METWLCHACRTGQVGEHCSNPVCRDNPSVSDEVKSMIADRAERERIDRAERDRLLEIRSRCFGKVS